MKWCGETVYFRDGKEKTGAERSLMEDGGGHKDNDESWLTMWSDRGAINLEREESDRTGERDGENESGGLIARCDGFGRMSARQ